MKVVGLDIGTMNLVASVQEGNDIVTKSIRNMYYTVDHEILSSSDIADSPIDWVVSKDDNDNDLYHVIGEDCFTYAKMFGQDVRRPMSKGVISSKDMDAGEILAFLLERLIGKAGEEGGLCIYSVPAQPVDETIPPVTYHERVFSRILKALGYTPVSLNEAMGVIYANCQKENYSGIALSFGCGLTNVVSSFKGTIVNKFAICRGGDWIDENAALSTDIPITRMTALKENNLDLLNPGGAGKREKVMRRAIVHYYEELIEYVLDVFVEEFKKVADGFATDDAMPIIVSGGSSLPAGFVELFDEILATRTDFPYKISGVRHADDPLSAVAIGNLIYGLWKHKKEMTEAPSKKKADKEGEKNPKPVKRQRKRG